MKTIFAFFLAFYFLLTPALLADTLDQHLEQISEQLLHDMQISLVKDLELKEPKTIAILPFQAIGSANAEVGLLLSDAMHQQLFGQGFWKLIERTQIDKLLKEQGFAQSHWADSEQTLEIGKLVGAEAVLIGSYLELNEGIRLNLRLVSVIDGTVLAAQTSLLERSYFGALLSQN